jgi:hypothetical protein
MQRELSSFVMHACPSCRKKAALSHSLKVCLRVCLNQHFNRVPSISGVWQDRGASFRLPKVGQYGRVAVWLGRVEGIGRPLIFVHHCPALCSTEMKLALFSVSLIQES